MTVSHLRADLFAGCRVFNATKGVAVGVEANAVAASERGKRAYRFEASAKLRETCAFALQRDLRSTGESLLLAAEILRQPFEPAPG